MKESAKTGKSIRTLAVEHGLVPEDEIDQVLDLLAADPTAAASRQHQPAAAEPA